MRPDDTTPNQEWLPLALPDDDDLAHTPDVVDAAALGIEPALPTAAPAAPDTAAPATPDADPPAAPAAATPAVPEPDAGDDDVPLPPDLQLVRAETPPEPKGRSWAGVLVVAAFAPFFVTGPLVVMGGNLLVWMIAYLAGASLLVAGGMATSRTLLTRGTSRVLPLAAAVVGLLTILGCAVAAVVGAQG